MKGKLPVIATLILVLALIYLPGWAIEYFQTKEEPKQIQQYEKGISSDNHPRDPVYTDETFIETEYTPFSYVDSYIDCLEWVDSTAFNAVGYHEDDSVLVVEFLESGSVYAYYGVPYYEYEEMIYSDSLGGYYNDYIKGYYDSERLL